MGIFILWKYQEIYINKIMPKICITQGQGDGLAFSCTSLMTQFNPWVPFEKQDAEVRISGRWR